MRAVLESIVLTLLYLDLWRSTCVKVLVEAVKGSILDPPTHWARASADDPKDTAPKRI